MYEEFFHLSGVGLLGIVKTGIVAGLQMRFA